MIIASDAVLALFRRRLRSRACRDGTITYAHADVAFTLRFCFTCNVLFDNVKNGIVRQRLHHKLSDKYLLCKLFEPGFVMQFLAHGLITKPMHFLEDCGVPFHVDPILQATKKEESKNTERGDATPINLLPLFTFYVDLDQYVRSCSLCGRNGEL